MSKKRTIASLTNFNHILNKISVSERADFQEIKPQNPEKKMRVTHFKQRSENIDALNKKRLESREKNFSRGKSPNQQNGFLNSLSTREESRFQTTKIKLNQKLNNFVETGNMQPNEIPAVQNNPKTGENKERIRNNIRRFTITKKNIPFLKENNRSGETNNNLRLTNTKIEVDVVDKNEKIKNQILDNSKINKENNSSNLKFSLDFKDEINLIKSLNIKKPAKPNDIIKVDDLKIKSISFANQDIKSIKSSGFNTSQNIPNVKKIVEKENEKILNYSDKKIIPEISRKIKSITEITQTGFNGETEKKFNQDSFFIYRNFNNNKNSILFGVCDGHGLSGHEVSSFIKEHLPKTIELNFKTKLNQNESNKFKLIKDSFLKVNTKLCEDKSIETDFSGSTCVTVLFRPDRLVCSNVGDSRAVLGRKIQGEWKSHALSRDHKPDNSEEEKRIKSKMGRVEPMKDDYDQFVGPARVWLMNQDYPGLAMSRSFGDKIAAYVGVISEPEILEFELTNDDKFIIIASDGMWEFIDSQECVDMVKQYYISNDIIGARELLIKESTRRWREEDEVIDDITILIIFLE